jgi:hypothetical protein
MSDVAVGESDDGSVPFFFAQLPPPEGYPPRIRVAYSFVNMVYGVRYRTLPGVNGVELQVVELEPVMDQAFRQACVLLGRYFSERDGAVRRDAE